MSLLRIKFDENRRIFLNLFFKPFGDVTMLKSSFKVDTGADVSTISVETLHGFMYTDEWIHNNKKRMDGTMSVATGETSITWYVQLPLVNICGYEAKNWPFIVKSERVHPCGEHVTSHFRNLIGRDLLAGFNYRINNDQSELELERASKYWAFTDFLPGQEIYEVNHVMA